jgi:hypothetical protein
MSSNQTDPTAEARRSEPTRMERGGGDPVTLRNRPAQASRDLPACS